MEHFGMMATETSRWGCILTVVDKGGQPEIISLELNGLLWYTIEGIQESMLIDNDPKKGERLAKATIEMSRQFQADQFEIKLKQLLA